MSKQAKPFYRKSKKSWYVRHQGRMLSLGKDKAAAFQKWHELEAQPTPAPQPGKCQTLAELTAAYELHAEFYYRKDGRPTSEVHVIRDALRRLRKVCGDVKLTERSPRQRLAAEFVFEPCIQ